MFDQEVHELAAADQADARKAYLERHICRLLLEVRRCDERSMTAKTRLRGDFFHLFFWLVLWLGRPSRSESD